MATDNLVVGTFSFVDDAVSAVRTVRDQGYNDVESFSPIPDHHLEEEMYRGKARSPVRMFTLLGGLTGCLGAFLFTSWMSVDYPLRTSAKPLISIPAFVVIAFECTILLGAIFTLLSMLGFSGIPKFFRSPAHRAQFTEGRYGISVRVSEENSESVKHVLESCGAEEVELQYVR